MNVEIVVGSNYGDEGKGQTTYETCKTYNKPIVVLTNGGCQRGHTVDDGIRRHVFHHFGSGTFLHSPSYFPATYFMNPMQYVKEYGELEKLGFTPIAFRSEKCLMQFPSDMLVNQVLENYRNTIRHGSCGWGIWETVLRNRYWPITIEEFDRLDINSKKELYLEIFHRQIDERLGKIDTPFKTELVNLFKSDSFIHHFIADFDFMYNSSRILCMDDVFFNNAYDCIVFENAQGLLLDENYSYDAIHSTPSLTGLNGVVHCICSSTSDSFDINEYVDNCIVKYVSRTYLTRHGAGSFREHDPNLKFEDLTNTPNDWQESMRFGLFSDASIRDFYSRISDDFNNNSKMFRNISKEIIFTHQDQLEIPNSMKGL